MQTEAAIYFTKLKMWQPEMLLLQQIILACNLTETLKWRVPCYTLNNKNIILIGTFKAYCAIIFFKGTLLKDEHKVLIQQTENVQSSRLIKFTKLSEIKKNKSLIIEYINEAIAIETASLKVAYKSNNELVFAAELQQKLNELPSLKKAFAALTPGRQRAYNLYFTGAVQTTTRANRVAKYIPQILKGIGINDCTCGLSKKLPYCDGSHKYAK